METKQTIRGDLAAFSLPDLLQTLQSNASVGTLTLHAPEEDLFAYISETGGVSLLYQIEPYLLRTARRLFVQSLVDRPTAELLTRGKLDQVEEQVRQQFEHYLNLATREGLYDIFRITSGKFTFRNGPKKAETQSGEPLAEGGSFQVTALLMEALRRVDEWGNIEQHVPWLGEVPVISEQPRDTLSEDISAVLATIDGKQPVGQLVLRSHFERFDYCRLLSSLISSKVVRFYDDAELIEQAEQQQSSDPEIALARLALLTRRNPDNADHMNRYATLLEAEGQDDRAVETRQRQAEILVQQGDPAQAQEVLASLLPKKRNVTIVRRRLIDIALDNHAKQGQATISLGPVVQSELDKLRGTKSHEDALTLIDRVIEAEPDQTEHRLRKINVLLDLERKTDAIAEYEALASKANIDGNPELALTCYKKLVALDRTNQTTRKKLEKMEHARHQQRGQRSRKSLMVLLLLAAALGVGGLGYLGKQRWSASRSAAEKIRKENPGEALAIYRKFAKRWWFTPWAGTAQAEADVIQQALNAIQSEKVKQNSSRIRELLAEAKTLYEQHQLQAAQALLRSAEGTEELEAKVKQTLEKTLAAYQEEWTRAVALRNSALAHEKAGKYQQAFGDWLKLRSFEAAGSLIANLTIPLQVTVNHVPLQVQLDHKSLGTYRQRTFVLRLQPELSGKLRFRCRGHKELVVEVGDQTGMLTIELERKAEWVYPTSSAIVAPLAHDSQSLYVPTTRNTLHSIRHSDGTLVWKDAHGTLQSMLSQPIVIGSVIWVLSSNNVLHKIDAIKGKPFPESPVVKQKVNNRNPAVLIRTPKPGILFGERTLWVYWIEAAKLEQLMVPSSPLKGVPLVTTRGNLYCATEKGEILAFDLAQRKQRWARPLGTPCEGRLQVWNELLIVAGADGKLRGLSADSGAVLWKLSLGGALRLGSLSGNKLLVSSTTGQVTLVQLSRSAATVTWRHEQASVGFAPALLPTGEGIVYVGGNDGVLRALSLTDGTKLWSFEGVGAIQTRPTVAGDFIYFGTEKEKVYALYRK